MKHIICLAFTALIAGCGGGGNSNNQATGPAAPTVPTAPVLASLNAADSLKKFMSSDQTISNLNSNDGYLGTATLSVSKGEIYPFATNGTSQQVTSVRVISFLRSNSSGKLQFRNTWKLHLDAQMKPIGVAIGHADAGFTECMSITTKNELPTATNSSGIYFSGIQTSNYIEGFKSGNYAHYCDPASTTVSNAEWSVAEGLPNPYFCLTMPASSYAAKTRICIPVDRAGSINNSAWIRVFNSDGSISVDYKNTSLNKPIEQFSSTIDNSNYWYGAVWRPLDGYVYQSYQDTKFSSVQACREQSAIDWKTTYSASNISWTCINVKSK